MHKILISSLLLFLALVLPTQANQVTVLIEGYDRFPPGRFDGYFDKR